MATIRSYYDHMREHDPDTFRVDDVTWSDLDMDRVFKRINPGVSTRSRSFSSAKCISRSRRAYSSASIAGVRSM